MTLPVDYWALFQASPNSYMLLSRDLTIVAVNDAYLQATGSTRAQLVGCNVFEVFPNEAGSNAGEGVQILRASFERVLAQRERDTLALVSYQIPGLDGSERYWSATHTPILDAQGEVVFILQHTTDVSELERAPTLPGTPSPLQQSSSAQVGADVLHRAETVQTENRLLHHKVRRLHALFEQTPGFVALLTGPEHVFQLVNNAFRQLVGDRDVLGLSIQSALPELSAQGFIELLDRVYVTREPYVGRCVRVLLQMPDRDEPTERFVDFVYQPIVEHDGAASGIFVQGTDVTDQRLTEQELIRYREHLEELVTARTQALRASEAERMRAEAALLQAQKMEAVGKLTGGVAHDFNNVLQIIGGNLQLLDGTLASQPESHRRLRIALTAVGRGARLASQLLSFGRRQPLEPRVLNLGRLLRGMDELLRHALGERVEIETVIAGGLWNACVDPHHLENVILNLAINASDAMSGDGRLTIEAGNAMLDDTYAAAHVEVSAGQYVMLAVSDTGCGMAASVVERAFDPFFSTKPEGEGTGLGLSMAYGFVKQSGGHIKIYSEPGLGSTVKVYLPRSVQAETYEPTPAPGQAVAGGSETILVVEDDEGVRVTVVDILSELGYQVLKASDARSALVVLQSGMRIDLLFTDVVMPGPLTSTELARQAIELMPGLAVLFTSGYTENAIVHGGRLDPGVHLLSKPYRREDLARKVRQMLSVRDGDGVSPERGDAAGLPGAAGASMAPDAMPDETYMQSCGPLRILLVEDDADTRVATAELMEVLGYRVEAVGSAEEALAAAEMQAFDVLFTDLGLPGMQGDVLAHRLRERHAQLHIIFASGYGSDAPGQTRDSLGVRVLPKPYRLDELQAMLVACKADRDAA
jgi:PAS domain S-box-containing protein